MTDKSSNELLPEPKVTGVLPEQIKSDKVHIPIAMPPSTEGMRVYTVSEDLESAIDTGYDDRTVRVLLRTNAATNERDLNRARSEISLLRQEIEVWKKKYYDNDRDCSVLKERAIRYREQRMLQNILVTFGGLIAGGSLKYIDGQNGNIAITVMLFGCAFVVIGWLYPFSKEKEQ